jgi:uncharacterized protein (TIGR02145 family)
MHTQNKQEVPEVQHKQHRKLSSSIFSTKFTALVSLGMMSILALLSSCSETSGDGDEVATTYGFGLQAYMEEFGTPDSASVWILEGNDTLQSLYIAPEDMDLEEGVVRFNIDAAREAQVTVAYYIYNNGEACAGGRQTFVSGETPSVPRPQFKPEVSAGNDTTISRNSNFAFDLQVELREENIEEYSLDIDGDGEVDYSNGANANFTHIYDTPEVYNAVFVVEDDLGLRDADTVEITIVPQAPQVELSSDTTVSINDSIALALNITFDDSTHLEEAQLIWTMGDSLVDTTALVAERFFVFATAGEYELGVEVLDAWGTSVSESMLATVVQDAPVVDAGAATLKEVNQTVVFFAQVEQDFGEIVEVGWDFDGDTSGGVWDTVLSVNAQMDYVYEEAGDYTALFYALDDDGNYSVDSREVTITRPSGASVHVPDLQNWHSSDSVVTINDEITFFIDTYTDANGSSDIKHFIWDFGDGEEIDNALAGEVTHAFSTAGEYMVHIRLVDSNGDSDEDSLMIVVLQGNPSVNAGSDTQVGIGDAVSFSGTASDDNSEGSYDAIDGSFSQYSWDYDGDGVVDATNVTNIGFSHSYEDVSADSTYIAEFCATDDDGNEVCDSRSVRVVNRAPVISGIYASSTLVYSGDEITLSLSGMSDADNNGIDSVYWDLSGTGSGAFSTARSLSESVIYSNSVVGEYSIRARVHDVWGAWDTLSIAINVYLACSGSFTDSRDGQEYGCVIIGNQVWMAENLKYLPQVDAVANGSLYGKYYYVYAYTPSGASEAEEIANAKATTNYQTYGVLYNWHAAMDASASSATNPSGVQGVCPDGWHLPSDAEWTELSDFVDLDNDGDASNSNEGTSLKATSGWNSDGNGTDDYGFSALPGGYRNFDGYFDYVGNNGHWWSATELNSSDAYNRILRYSYSDMYRGYYDKIFGFSVRCLQDTP